ncbi:Hypothetical protein CINCED_3A012483, partial [Cinara cedri]
ISRKFSKTSVRSITSIFKYKSEYSPNVLHPNLLHTAFACSYSVPAIFSSVNVLKNSFFLGNVSSFNFPQLSVHSYRYTPFHVTRDISSLLNTFIVSRNLTKSGVNKFDARDESFDAIKRPVSINLTVKVLLTYFENEINFSALLGMTEIVSASYPSSLTMKCASYSKASVSLTGGYGRRLYNFAECISSFSSAIVIGSFVFNICSTRKPNSAIVFTKCFVMFGSSSVPLIIIGRLHVNAVKHRSMIMDYGTTAFFLLVRFLQNSLEISVDGITGNIGLCPPHINLCCSSAACPLNFNLGLLSKLVKHLLQNITRSLCSVIYERTRREKSEMSKWSSFSSSATFNGKTTLTETLLFFSNFLTSVSAVGKDKFLKLYLSSCTIYPPSTRSLFMPVTCFAKIANLKHFSGIHNEPSIGVYLYTPNKVHLWIEVLVHYPDFDTCPVRIFSSTMSSISLSKKIARADVLNDLSTVELSTYVSISVIPGAFTKPILIFFTFTAVSMFLRFDATSELIDTMPEFSNYCTIDRFTYRMMSCNIWCCGCSILRGERSAGLWDISWGDSSLMVHNFHVDIQFVFTRKHFFDIKRTEFLHWRVFWRGALGLSNIVFGVGNGGALNISSPINAVKTELEPHFEPCLIDTGDAKKRYSVAQYGPASNGHLSVIGGATLTRAPKPLSPYQSWTASQLLHEHERRTSPYGQIGDFDGQYAPPVPPLPAYQQQQLQQQQQQQQQQQANVENIYGTAPGHYNQQPQQNGLPPPGQYNSYHRNNMILFNQSLQGSLSSVSSGDKKKRNITMV